MLKYAETSAVNFFSFFNFVFLLDEKNVDHDGPIWSRKGVKIIICNARQELQSHQHQFRETVNSVGRGQFITTSAHFNLTKRWVTSWSNVANRRVTAGSEGLSSHAPHMLSSFQKVHDMYTHGFGFSGAEIVIPKLTLTEMKQAHWNETSALKWKKK